jgi:hypothetical protein
MRPLDYFLVTLCVIAIVAGTMSFVQQENTDGNLNGTESPDNTVALAERMDELTEQIATFQRRSANDISQLSAVKASTLDVQRLKEQIALLQAALAAEIPAGLKMKIGADGKEQLVAVEDYIKSRVAAAAKVSEKKARSRRFTDAKPFIQMGMKREVAKMVKKLKLNATQTEQMETSFNEAMDKTLPQLSVILDKETPAAERTAAIATVQSTMSEVTTQASSYLDPEQYEQFTQLQQQQMGGLNGIIAWGQSMNATTGSSSGNK